MASNSNWVYLDEALSSPEKYGDLTQKFIDYTPDYSTTTFSWERTFAKGIQEASTEPMEWHPILIPAVGSGKDDEEKEVYLVASHTTEFKLALRGYMGHYYAVSNLNSYNRKLYSNRRLGIKGIGTNTEIISTLLEASFKADKAFWIASYVKQFEYAVWGVDINNQLHPYVLLNNKEAYCESLALLPVVYVPSNILVNLGNPERDGSTPGKALELKVLRSTSVSRQ